MKRYFILLILGIISSIWLLLAIVPGKGEQVQHLQQVRQVQDVQPAGAHKETLRPDINFGKIPLYFVANQGQVNEKALFYAKASRYTLWLTKEGLVFDSTRKVEEGKQTTEDKRQISKDIFLPASMHPCNIIPTYLTHLTHPK